MFDPHAHIFEAVLKAVFAAMLVAMAGGFPYCCEEGAGSTSTGSSLPPGSTGSTSTGYVVPRFACQWCVGGISVASQYVVEVAGFANAFCDCVDLDGAYFIDDMSDGGYSSVVFFLISGCGAGDIDTGTLTCPGTDANVSVSFLAAGNYDPGGGNQRSCTHFGIDLVATASFDKGYEFATFWSAAIPDATGTVPCDSLEGVALPYYNEFPFGAICVGTAATATPFEFTGF